MISSTCIYLKYVHPIYLYYGAFQSTCIYLNFVNILCYDVCQILTLIHYVEYASIDAEAKA